MRTKRILRLAALAVGALSPVTERALAAQALPPPAATAPKPGDLGLFVYAAKGQDAARQGQDESECYAWAREQTKIDPTAAAAPVQAKEVPKGGAVKGAARGAAKGAAVGAIGDDEHARDEGTLDAGEGAGAGAVAGAARGRRAQKKAEKQSEKQAQQATQQNDVQAKETFKKAWGACLEGRGYSVK